MSGHDGRTQKYAKSAGQFVELAQSSPFVAVAVVCAIYVRDTRVQISCRVRAEPDDVNVCIPYAFAVAHAHPLKSVCAYAGYKVCGYNVVGVKDWSN